MLTPECRHGNTICSMCLIADDAARRAFDQIRQMVHDTSYEERTRQSPYVAIKLSDGSTDKRMYDTKQACVRAQLHEYLCAYFSFRTAPQGFSSPRDAGIFLAFHRAAYDNGWRLPDPDAIDGGPDIIMPTPREHVGLQLGRFLN